MKNISRILMLAAAVLLPSVAQVAPAHAAAVKTLKMAVSDPSNAEMGVMAEAFKKALSEKSGGELSVEIYYGGSLGEETETLHNVRGEALDLSCVGISNVVPFAKKLGVVTLPYIFDTLEQVEAGTNGAANDMLNSYAKEGGFRIVSWVYSGFRHLSNSKHPVEKLEDMVGLQIRVPQSTVMLSTYKAWNAIPILLGWNDVYSALADHTVDGQCYGYAGFNSMNFIKAGQKYMTELHYTYLLQPLVMSEKVFMALSPEHQKAVTEAGKIAQDVALAYMRDEVNNAKNTLTVQGLKITVLDDEDEWKRVAVSTVWPEMAAFVGGKPAINAYLKAIGKAEWQ